MIWRGWAQEAMTGIIDNQQRLVFDKPTKVGDRILMGRYLIEHDNVRMARG